MRHLSFLTPSDSTNRKPVSRHRDRGRGSEWARRLEVNRASRRTTSANHGAARTIAHLEFKFIGAGGNRANHHCERSVALDVGQNHTDFNRGGVLRHALPCEWLAGPGPAFVRELSKRCRKCAAEEVQANLVELA